MITSDFHVHTDFSPDSGASPETMVRRALALGLEVICFTDHDDTDYFENGHEFKIDTAPYVGTILDLQEQYRDRIDVRLGIEIGIQPQLGEVYQEYVASWPFDFVIGSAHTIERSGVYLGEFFKGRSDEEGYRISLLEILEDVRIVRSMDVLGHLDYMIRYGANRERDFSYTRFSDEIDAILTTLIETGRGIEVNTSASRYGVGLWHPQTDIIRRYRELGGEIITVGSDAHVPEHLAWEFDAVEQMLLDCGFSYRTEFKAREPIFKRLG